MRRVLGPGDVVLARASGLVKIKPIASDSWHYRESGKMVLSSEKVLSFYKDYFVRRFENKISVYFDPDGKRLFHEVESQDESRAQGLHHCLQDVYRVRYSFDSTQSWKTFCQVKGPKKDYQIESVYTAS